MGRSRFADPDVATTLRRRCCAGGKIVTRGRGRRPADSRSSCPLPPARMSSLAGIAERRVEHAQNTDLPTANGITRSTVLPIILRRVGQPVLAIARVRWCSRVGHCGVGVVAYAHRVIDHDNSATVTPTLIHAPQRRLGFGRTHVEQATRRRARRGDDGLSAGPHVHFALHQTPFGDPAPEGRLRHAVVPEPFDGYGTLAE